MNISVLWQTIILVILWINKESFILTSRDVFIILFQTDLLFAQFTEDILFITIKCKIIDHFGKALWAVFAKDLL